MAVDKANYLSSNPDFIVNGFIRAEIAAAFDGTEEKVMESEFCLDSSHSEDSDDNDDEDC